MKSPSKVKARRCRPLLGTFVEIKASAADETTLGRGFAAAFAAVEKVHRLMSFHDPASDVSRMNRDAFSKVVQVHPWTWQVMETAQDFSRESEGMFDLTVASRLTESNYLPRSDYRFDSTASWRDIFLRQDCKIFFRRQLIVDLGGIAKGFAVDRAIEALQMNGLTGGIVNAGGDVRVFGSNSHLFHLRHPSRPTRAAGLVKLRNRAIATSGVYFTRRNCGNSLVSPLLNGRTRRCVRELVSVTVGAADCITADALTKIVFALREKAAPLLVRHRADALLLEHDGSPCWRFHPPCDIRDLIRSD